MANGAPSPNGAAKVLQGSVPNLGDLKALPPELVALGKRQAELHEFKRCSGCERRITEGFIFTRFEPQLADGAPTVVAIRRAACGRDDCDYSEKCAAGADVAEYVEYAWLDTKRLVEAGKDPDEEEQRMDVMAKLGRGETLTDEEKALIGADA